MFSHCLQNVNTAALYYIMVRKWGQNRKRIEHLNYVWEGNTENCDVLTLQNELGVGKCTE